MPRSGPCDKYFAFLWLWTRVKGTWSVEGRMKNIFRMGLEHCRSTCRLIVRVEMLCPGLGRVTSILRSCSFGPG